MPCRVGQELKMAEDGMEKTLKCGLQCSLQGFLFGLYIAYLDYILQQKCLNLKQEVREFATKGLKF